MCMAGVRPSNPISYRVCLAHLLHSDTDFRRQQAIGLRTRQYGLACGRLLSPVRYTRRPRELASLIQPVRFKDTAAHHVYVERAVLPLHDGGYVRQAQCAYSRPCCDCDYVVALCEVSVFQQPLLKGPSFAATHSSSLPTITFPLSQSSKEVLTICA